MKRDQTTGGKDQAAPQQGGQATTSPKPGPGDSQDALEQAQAEAAEEREEEGGYQ